MISKDKINILYNSQKLNEMIIKLNYTTKLQSAYKN